VDVFNPSTLDTYERCPFYFYIQHELNMMRKEERIISHMMMGSLIHEATAAHDIKKYGVKLHGMPEELQWADAIKRLVQETRTSQVYHRDDDEMLHWLAVEAAFSMRGQHADTNGGYYAADGSLYRPDMNPTGGYIEWRNKQNWETISIEKRYKADLGAAIIAPKPDGVVRLDGKLYILERKTSQTSWEADYKRKFRLQFQTTLEVLAVERYYDEPVVGVLLTPIFYTRKKSKKWQPRVPQPLHRMTFDPPRPIPKKNAKAAAEQWFDNFTMHELPWRRKTGCWQQRFRSCHEISPCFNYELCWGGHTLANNYMEVKRDGWPDALYKEVQKHLWD
jgi:adenylate kinase family enzyme